MRAGHLPQELHALTGIRAVFAWWVVIYHMTIPELAPLAAGIFEPLRAHGYLGVDGFFVLSGFILAHVYTSRFDAGEPGLYRKFLLARLARIYPLHAVTLGIVAGLFVFSVLAFGLVPNQPERFALREFVLHVLMLHGWGFSRMLAWNYPSWSISAEWAAYLCFPLVYRIVLRGGSVRRAALVASAMAAGLVLFEQLGPNGNLSYTFEFALVRIGLEFTLGASLLVFAQAWLADPMAAQAAPRPHAALSFTAAVAGLLLGVPDAAVVLLMAAGLLFLSHSADALGRLLSTRTLVYGGETSYAVYMVHAIVQGVAIIALRRLPALLAVPGWARLLVLLVIVQVAATLAWRLVERPARAWMRDVGRVRFADYPAQAARPL